MGDPNGARHDPPLHAGETLYRLACLTASVLAHGTGDRVIRAVSRVAVDMWTRFAGPTYPQHDNDDKGLND